MDSPRKVDVKEREDEENGAEDWGHDVFERWDPGREFRRRLLDGKSAVCIGTIVGLGAVVGLDVGRRYWFRRHGYLADL